jgi:hypothetical protein
MNQHLSIRALARERILDEVAPRPRSSERYDESFRLSIGRSRRSR